MGLPSRFLYLPAPKYGIFPTRMLKLEDLQVDTHVVGVEPSGQVKVLYVKKAGPEIGRASCRERV